MKARFRIRTRDGRDLEPRTLEVLADLVRSGAVGPDDLVFDALTSEWAPARTHTVVRMFSDGNELTAGSAARAGGGAGGSRDAAFGEFVAGAGAPGSPADDLPLDLVGARPPEPDEAFIARMEEERRQGDPDLPDLFREGTLVDEGKYVLRGFARPGRQGPFARRADRRRKKDTRPAPAAAPPTRRRKRRSAPPGRGWVIAAVVPVAALIGSAAFLRPGAPERRTLATAEASAAVPLGSRPVRGEEVGLRDAAYAGFVDAVERLRLRFDIERLPADWLEGRYLADAPSYPEVRAFWERYVSYAEEAYASEVTFYREAYLAASQRAGVSGPVRSLRLAAAVEDFEAERSLREEYYARIWDLAESALALHDQLVHMRGRITYEPARGQRVSADPVIEAAGVDADTQERLEDALDRVLHDLRKAGGADLRQRLQVAHWLADGLREGGRPTS